MLQIHLSETACAGGNRVGVRHSFPTDPFRIGARVDAGIRRKVNKSTDMVVVWRLEFRVPETIRCGVASRKYGPVDALSTGKATSGSSFTQTQFFSVVGGRLDASGLRWTPAGWRVTSSAVG